MAASFRIQSLGPEKNIDALGILKQCIGGFIMYLRSRTWRRYPHLSPVRFPAPCLPAAPRHVSEAPRSRSPSQYSQRAHPVRTDIRRGHRWPNQCGDNRRRKQQVLWLKHRCVCCAYEHRCHTCRSRPSLNEAPDRSGLGWRGQRYPRARWIGSRAWLFPTMPMISTSSGALSCFSTFSLSAICGTALGETKLTASICLNPASISACKYCAFTSVGISLLRPCHASRGHSISFTVSLGIVVPGEEWSGDLPFVVFRPLFEEFFCVFEESFTNGRVFLTAKRSEFLELVPLFRIQTRWHLHE